MHLFLLKQRYPVAITQVISNNAPSCPPSTLMWNMSFSRGCSCECSGATLEGLAEVNVPIPHNCGRTQLSPSFYICSLMSWALPPISLRCHAIVGLGSSANKRRGDSLIRNKVVSTVFSWEINNLFFLHFWESKLGNGNMNWSHLVVGRCFMVLKKCIMWLKKKSFQK